MDAHLTGPQAKKVKDVVAAVCQDCYKGHKHRFKKYHFLKKDGYKNPNALRAIPPGKMPTRIPMLYVPLYIYIGKMPIYIYRGTFNAEPLFCTELYRTTLDK
jgi:hypothetical protein